MQQQFFSFIDKDFLLKLEKMHITAKKGISGTGIHRSGHKGEGLEFLDYRMYGPGDDVRYIDWNIFSRTDKLFIKLFHAESYRKVHIILDASLSMKYGDTSKFIYAQCLTALLSFLFLSHCDRVFISVFPHSETNSDFSTYGKKMFPGVLQFLNTLTPSGRTDLNRSLQKISNTVRKNEQVIIISDFLDEDGYEEGLRSIAYKGAEIDCIAIVDKLEMTFFEEEFYLLCDSESKARKSIDIDDVKISRYRNIIRSYFSRLEHFCTSYGFHFFMYQTDTTIDHFISEYINRKISVRVSV